MADRVSPSTSSETTTPAATSGTTTGRVKAADKIVFEGGVRNDDKELTELPGLGGKGGWDVKSHKPLLQKAFFEAPLYMEWRATIMEATAATLRQRATEERTLGDKDTRAKVKRLKDFRAKIEELTSSLGEQMGKKELATLMAQLDEQAARAKEEVAAEAAEGEEAAAK